MNTKKLILEELNKLEEDSLQELYPTFSRLNRKNVILI
jgi:hypothetical protein